VQHLVVPVVLVAAAPWIPRGKALAREVTAHEALNRILIQAIRPGQR
jgi:hypothetical protein